MVKKNTKYWRARDEYNEYKMNVLDFIHKRLIQKTEARTYIKNVGKAMFEYFQPIKPSPPEP